MLISTERKLRTSQDDQHRVCADQHTSSTNTQHAVLTRQMVEHGDPSRRATDHSESYGAALKESIYPQALRKEQEKGRPYNHEKARCVRQRCEDVEPAIEVNLKSDAGVQGRGCA